MPLEVGDGEEGDKPAVPGGCLELRLKRTRRRPLPGPPCGGDRQQTVRLISAAFGRNSPMGKSLVFGCSRAY